MTPGKTALGEILERSGVGLPRPALEKLWRYHQLLRAANAELNLTRLHNFETMARKHYVDSLLVLKYVDLPSPLLDLGTGPGLPGVPLKLARPELKLILCEPRGARVQFLREVVAELELLDVEVYPHKLDARFQSVLGGVINRAVGPIAPTLSRCEHALEAGGRVIFMKGPDCGAELAEAERFEGESFRRVLDQAYTIPETTHDRRLVVYERVPKGHRGLRSTLIMSESNARFHQFQEIMTGAGIRKHGLALMAGVRLRDEVIARHPEMARAWISAAQAPGPPNDRMEWVQVSARMFKELDVFGTHAPLVLVTVPAIRPWSDAEPWPLGCTLFVPFQDPENVGAVIRSAAAFGVSRVVLLQGSAHPFHPRSGRAAGPALFQVPLESGPPLRELDVRGAPLIALDTAGPALESAAFPERFGLVVGVEGPGLPEHLRGGERRRIPIAEGVESLNAAAAAAVALYAWSSQRS